MTLFFSLSLSKTFKRNPRNSRRRWWKRTRLRIGFARRFFRRLNKKQRGTCDVDNKQAETAIRFIEISTGGPSTVLPFKDAVLADSWLELAFDLNQKIKKIKDIEKSRGKTIIRVSRKNKKKKGINFERTELKSSFNRFNRSPSWTRWAKERNIPVPPQGFRAITTRVM